MILGERVESLKMVIDMIFVMFETDIRIVEVVNLKNGSNNSGNSGVDRRLKSWLEVEMLKEIHSHLIINRLEREV